VPTLSLSKFAFLAVCLSVTATAAADYPFGVKVTGKGKPILLIPGLGCTGDVWDQTVEHLKGRYQCHVLTLPGFGKQPPISGPFLPQVRDAIVRYVKEKKLNHPAVIGHSLGGFMTYYLDIAEPKLFGPLIAVDGVPWLTVLQNDKATIDSIKPTAEMIGKMMSTEPNAQFQAGILQALNAQITDPKDVAKVNATCKDSDQASVGRAIQEMMVTDLRPEVSKVQSPLLLIAAGQWATTDEQKAGLEASYKSQIATAPNAKLVVSWKSRHFVMLDDPQFFFKSIDQFLKENWAK